MKTHKIKLTELEPATYNPRQISNEEKEKLSQNLNIFGLVDPIVINLKNNRIIGGHQRYHTLIEKNPDKEYSLIKLGDIGWIFDSTDLKVKDENHEKALNISLNKIKGEWDLNKLQKLLDDIEDSDIDVDLTGFKPHELSILDDSGVQFSPQLFNFVENDDGDDFEEFKAGSFVTCPNCKNKIPKRG